MLSLIFAAALALRFQGALAAPQTFSNLTTANPPGPAVTNFAPTGICSNNCAYAQYDLYFITWSQMSITATYTAETVIFIVNKKNNSTRTTTVSNTEIDFGKIATPTSLNRDGTVTASVVDLDGVTRDYAYPTTGYHDYSPNITWTGTLSTTVSGTPTCSIAPTGAVANYPSHPLIPEGVQTKGVNTIEDPRGWTFVPVGLGTCGDPDNLIKNMFPGLGIWNCKPSPIVCEAPASVLEAALYLTKTSTSTEPDDGPTPMEAPASKTQSPVPQIQKITPTDILISTTPPAKLPPPTGTSSPEAFPTKAASAGGGFIGPVVPPVAPKLAPTMATTSAAKPMSTSSPKTQNAPNVPEPANDMLPVVSTTPAPVPSSIVITSAAGTASLTTPVAVLVPVTSTDSKGGISISTSTAIAHPVTVSSTNAQGNIVPSMSLSIALISASLPTIISSTNAQGTVVSSTAHLPAIILTTINSAGSQILTTSPLSLPTPPASAPVPITIDSQTITPNAQSQYIISSQTLTPGASITLGSEASATILALQTSSGSTALIYGPRTSLLPSASGTNPVPLIIGSETITPNSHSQYIISGSTLSAGGSSITLVTGSSTTVLGLQTSGSETALVYAPSTSVLTPTALPTIPPAITIGSETITANSETQYIIGSQTLTAGGVVTVSGTVVSLAAGESDVVIGSSTEALGPYITAGFGTGANGTGVQVFAGGAGGRKWGLMWGWKLLWMVGMVGTLMVWF